LKAAYQNLQKSDAPEYTAGFAASIFGVIGAAAGTLVSVRAMQKALMLRLSSTAPGMAFGNGFIKFLSSNLFARLSGYPAIFIGLYSDLEKTIRQERNGDVTASTYTLSGGATVAIGSVLVLEGSLAIAGPTFFIPFAGWAAAAIVLLGAAVIAGGVYLHAKASERIHNPIELWAARSIFGTRLNDGEIHPDISLDFEKKLPNYLDLVEEVKVWHAEYYSPILLFAEEAKKLGLENLSSGWNKNESWSPPNWTAIVHNNVPAPSPTVEFTVYLREFIVGQSEWSAKLILQRDSKTTTVQPLTPQCQITPSGLLLNFKHETKGAKEARLHITYRPNQGLYQNHESIKQFKLKE
ncbi:hypothetical protein NJH80_20550, partial [Pseudomonas putida]|nr:hypothetical protein [Pseudomonas putida]